MCDDSRLHPLIASRPILSESSRLMNDLARFCCQNPDCTLYGRRGLGNLSACGLYGKHKRFRQLYCHTCRARFSERKGTPLYRCHRPEEKAHAVLEHRDEGGGIRSTGRLVGVHRDTVVRLARAAGQHAHDAHDELVACSPRTSEVQFDEKWSFVAKKQKHCDPFNPADDHKGDWWDHVA
jgi:transposase-like protein